MDAKVNQERIVVDVTDAEVWRLLSGVSVGDRVNPLDPDSKITLVPSSRDFQGGLIEKPQATIASDYDISIYFDEQKLKDVRYGQMSLHKQDFSAVNGDERLIGQIPAEGMTVYFAGSLCVVDVMKIA